MAEVMITELAQEDSVYTVLEQEPIGDGVAASVLFKGEVVKFFVPNSVVENVKRIMSQVTEIQSE